MRHLKLFPATIDSERQVVEEEKRLRVDNNPIGKALERFRALAYVKHPYNWTPIGTIEDLEKVTPADCQKLLRHLLPAQQRDADRRRRRRRGDGAPAGRASTSGRCRAGPRRRAHDAPRSRRRRRRARRRCSSRCRCRWSSAAITSRAAADPDIPALEVLAAILSAGESSRLHQRLVRKRAPGDGRRRLRRRRWRIRGLFLVYAAYLPDRDRGQGAGGAGRGDRARARHSRSTRDELDKAKNQLAAAFIFGLQTVDGIAQALGTRAVRRGRLAPVRRGRDALPGGHRRRRAAGGEASTSSTRNLTRVTLAPARRRRRPRPAGRTRRDGARWAPSLAARRAGAAARAAPAARGRRQRRAPSRSQYDDDHRRRQDAGPSPRPGRDATDLIRAPAAAASRPSWRCRTSSASTLKNGLRGHGRAAQGPAGRQLRRRRPGGRLRRGPREKLGVADFVAAMLRARAPRRAAPTTSRAPSTSSAARSTRRRRPRARPPACSALSKDAQLCLDLLSDILLRPSFPESEMGEVRDQMLAAVAARYDNPHELATAHFDNLLFGEKHPDGWVLTAEDVEQDHARAPGDVLEDVLPPEPRHPGRRRRRRRRRGCAPASRRRSAAGHAATVPARPACTMPAPRRRASCSSIGPTRRRRRSCSATRASGTPIRGGTRRR